MTEKITYENGVNENELVETLNHLLKNVESEIVEFKEARNIFDFDKLGRYVSAISNEANLRKKQYGWLIFGINDKTHEFVGTNYKDSSRAIQQLKLRISEHTTGGLTFMNIYIIYPKDKEKVKRIIMFQIPAAAISIPTGWKNRYYDRKGESLSEMSFDKLDRIRGEHLTDWSKELISEATMEDLDQNAIKVARENYYQVLKNSSNPEAVKEYKKLNDKDFLTKIRLIINGQITKAAMILLGKGNSEIFFDLPPQIMWRLHNSKGDLTDSHIFTIPFVLAVDKAYKKIRNLTYKYIPSQLSLFPTETQQYDSWTLRELINNCIAHQDYRLGTRIYIDEFEDHLVITNGGKFLPGNVKPVLDPAYAPPYYRNPLLDTTMVKFRMIETASSGIRRVYSIQQKKLFPLPDYDLSQYNKVKVTIYGHVLDEKYTQALFKNPRMDLETAFLLDKVQKHKPIDKEDAAKLRKEKLIEGRLPNLYISAPIAKTLDQKPEYVKNKGFSDKYYKDLIVEYLSEWKTGRKADFVKLLNNKLPERLSEHQKEGKVKNYLQALRHTGIITTQTSETGKRSRIWILSKDK